MFRRLRNPAANVFGPKKPLFGPYTYRVKQNVNGDTLIAVYHGSKRIAHIDAFWAYSMRAIEEHEADEAARGRGRRLVCATDLRSLGAEGKYPNVLRVGHAFMDDEAYKGKGIGRAMYEAMMVEGFAVRETRIGGQPGPMFLVPDECGGAGNTSADAKRVWASLTRDYPSRGTSIRVDAPPVIGSRAKVNPRRRKTVADPGPVSSPAVGRAWAATGALPTPLYHATPRGPQVMQTGLLSLAEVIKRGLGGATLGVNNHAGFVSTTPLREGALRLAALMQARNEMKVNPVACVRWWMEKYVRRLKQYDPEQYEKIVLLWGQVTTKTERTEDYPGLGYSHAASLSGYGFGELLNNVRKSVQDAHPEYTFPFFAGMGGHPESGIVVDPRSIGVVTLYARVDGETMKDRGHFFCSATRGGRPDEGFLGFGPRGIPVSRMDEEELLDHLSGADGGKHYYNIKEGAGKNDVFEVLVCSQDTTVVKFEPVLDWRRILDPKNLPSFLR